MAHRGMNTAQREDGSFLGGLTHERRVIVFVGAGGAGKTTLSAATAVRASRAGLRVACLTIDPARRLAESLGVAPATGFGALEEITPKLGADVREGGALSIGMLDPKEAFDRFVRSRASSPERARRILDNKLFRYISGSLNGMQEYMALETLCELCANPEIDLVVLDTPPTANALDFFTAPKRMLEALDSPMLRVLRQAHAGQGALGLDLFGRFAKASLRATSKVTGAELLDEMMGFVDALSDLFGSFSERAAAVERTLHGKEVAFCLVATPDPATMRETREFRHRLHALGLAVSAVIFNRCHAPRSCPPPPAAPLSEEISALNAAWNAAYDTETARISEVEETWPSLSALCVVPLLPDSGTRIDSLDVVASYL